MEPSRNPEPSLREVALCSLKVGLTSFGGPLVAMGLIHREAVERRKWVTPEWFASTMGLMEAVPGPSATEMAISVGVAKHGRMGGLVSGLAYVLPGFFIIVGLSAAYFHYGAMPAVSGLIAGLKPAAMAVLTAVCLRLTRSIVKDAWDGALLAASMAACLLGASVVWTILLAGTLRLLVERRASLGLAGLAPLALLGIPPDGIERLPSLFLDMLKAGALVTGGGYVIASFLEQDFVVRRGWLSHEEFLAGLALAQFKPGPVILLSAFVGYKVAGLLGSVVAAFAVLLPCFGTLLAVGPSIERLRTGPSISVFLRGMGAGSVGAILAVAVQLFLPAVMGKFGWLLYALSLAALYKLEPGWVLLGAALAGLAFL